MAAMTPLVAVSTDVAAAGGAPLGESVDSVSTDAGALPLPRLAALAPLPTPVLAPVSAPVPVPMSLELVPPQQPEAVGLSQRLSARAQLHPGVSEAAFSQPPTSAGLASDIAHIASDQRTAYLDYLRLCLRQQRVPAPEVVEMGRSSGGSALQDGSLVSLQIRMTEEALGI